MAESSSGHEANGNSNANRGPVSTPEDLAAKINGTKSPIPNGTEPNGGTMYGTSRPPSRPSSKGSRRPNRAPTFSDKVKRKFFPPDLSNKNRTVYIDNKLFPGMEPDLDPPVYPDNRVVSSKYTLLTFLPKNLFEQFRRIANFYFLCVGVIQFLIDTPVTPLTSVLPLGFVISVTAVKQGYEDWLRHKADNEVNLRPATILRKGAEVTDTKAQDIKVGDVVKVYQNEEFPCDLVLLASADPAGICYVTTANLDGETNLKTLFTLPDTRDLTDPTSMNTLRAKVTAKPPLADLYTFEGLLECHEADESKPLGPDNLLLRGARLKNTEHVYGLALYTGRDAKMAMNSRFKQAKFSQVERKMNTFLLVFLAILLIESVLCTCLKYYFEGVHGNPDYVPEADSKAKVLEVIENILSFMVLFNYIIPISLYVSAELQKFLGSIFFGMDMEMYDESIDERALANTSDLNEELGQVEYLFTDKTGTLTENTMEFKLACIGSRSFEDVNGTLCEKLKPDAPPSANVTFTNDIDSFLSVLVLCHTCRVDLKSSAGSIDQGSGSGAASIYSATGEEYDYQASSPDEKALVEACCRYGIIYHGMKDDVMEATFHKQMRRYKLLHTLPFDPTRKRMSVVVQDDKGVKTLLCKGAEVAILDRVVSGDVATTERMVTEYATLGLRTLTIAQRKFTEAEYQKFNEAIGKAQKSLVDREKMLSAVFHEWESQLTLLGATAVEDKLQDGVPETIQALRAAGIKVWVLTGDKEETAVNISHSAGHFHKNMTELRLTSITSEEQCQEQIKHFLSLVSESSTQVKNPAVVIDGQSLKFALHHPEELRQLCSYCEAVLCCRMSPIQKAKVVGLIKQSPEKPVTAAIGDGANDVSMIQEADVGLAIMGKEGRQAVRNSDYAFGKFRFLQRVFLLHGHLYYNRIAVLVQYFFYKNVACMTAQVFYAFFNYYSQQSLYDPFMLLFYNLAFTSLPILMYGLFEQHKTKEDLLAKPHLYKNVTRNALLSWPEFLRWNLLGLWHCCVFFFGFMLLINNDVSIFSDGETIGNAGFGSMIYMACVVAVNMKLLFESYYWCLPVILSHVLSYVAVIVNSAVYSNVWLPDFLVDDHAIYKLFDNIYATPTPWLAGLMLFVLALLPDMIFKIVKDTRDNGVSQNSKCGVMEDTENKHITKVHPAAKHAYDNPAAVDVMPDGANLLPSVTVISARGSSQGSSRSHVVTHNAKPSEVNPVIVESTTL